LGVLLIRDHRALFKKAICGIAVGLLHRRMTSVASFAWPTLALESDLSSD
jgi:hypothetical protein